MDPRTYGRVCRRAVVSGHPSVYTIKAAVQGFKSFERRGIRLGTQQFITLDVTLEVGTVEESITVTA